MTEGQTGGIMMTEQARFPLLTRVGTAIFAAVALAVASAAVASTAGASAAAVPAAGATVAPAVLQSLDCRSVSRCVAVGVNTPDSPPLLEGDNWNGRAWVRVPVPRPPLSGSVRLAGVACPANHVCVAVGKVQPQSGGSTAIAGVWNGTRWSVATAAAAGTSA